MSRKAEQLIAAVSNKPIKIAEAYRLAGTNVVKNLIDSAYIVKYVDENPDYATCVIGGQKPMCFWVKLGDVKYVPPQRYSRESGTVHASEAIRDSLKNFDSLPDSAHVRILVVQALFACSSTTVWRMTRTGELPEPRKFSERLTAWNVGDLRKCLMSK